MPFRPIEINVPKTTPTSNDQSSSGIFDFLNKATSEAIGAGKRFFSGTVDSAKKQVERSTETQQAYRAGEIGLPRAILETIGEGILFGTAPVSGAYEAVAPAVSEGLKRGEQILQKATAPIQEGVRQVVDLSNLQETIDQKLNDNAEKVTQWWEGLDNNAKREFEVAGDTIMRVLDFVGAGQSAKAGKIGVNTAIDAAKVATAKTGQAVKSAGKFSMDLANNTAAKLSPIAIKFSEKLKSSLTPKKDISDALKNKTIEVFEAEELAKQFGVELPASSFASPWKSKTEQILAEGIFGGKLKEKAVKAVENFEETLTKLQKEAPTSGELGEQILQKFKTVEKEKENAIKQLYDSVEELATTKGVDIEIVPTSSLAVVKDLLRRKRIALNTGIGKKSDVKLLENIQKGLEVNKDLATSRIALKEIGDLANFKSFNPTTDEKTYRQLYNTLKKDIDDAMSSQLPEISETLKLANETFADFAKLKERPFVKSIKSLGKKGDVDMIANNLTQTKISTNEIEQIYNTLGEEVTEKIQHKIIADIIEKAKSPTGGFTPAGFAKQIKSIGDERMNKILTKDQISLLKNIDKINQLIDKGTAVSKGSQTAIIGQLTQALKGIVAWTTYGGTVIAEGVLARFLGSAKGQNFLKGIDSKLIEKLRKQAGETPKQNIDELFQSSKETPPYKNPIKNTTNNAVMSNDVAPKAEAVNTNPSLEKGAIPETNSAFLNEAKKYKTAKKYLKAKGLQFEYEAANGEKRVVIDLFPKKSIKGKNITKLETLNAFKEAFKSDHKIIEPSNGLLTKDGKGFMEALVKDGWIQKTDNRGGIERYIISPKIEEFSATPPLTKAWKIAHSITEPN